MGAGVDIGDHDGVKGVEAGGGEGLSEPVTGARHERGVKSPPHRHGHDALGPELFGDGAELSSASIRPATMTWPGALKLAIQASPSTRRQAVSTVSSSSPRRRPSSPGRSRPPLASPHPALRRDGAPLRSRAPRLRQGRCTRQGCARRRQKARYRGARQRRGR